MICLLHSRYVRNGETEQELEMGEKELDLTAKENTATLGKQSAEHQAGLQELQTL